MKKQSFLDKMSIKKRLILLILSVNFIFLILVPIINTWQISTKIYEDKKAILASVTDMTVGILKGYQSKYDEGLLSKEEAKEYALKEIKQVRYNQKGYFWIHDLNNKMVMHPIKPDMDGKDLSGDEDLKGLKLFDEMTKIAKDQGQGFLQYYWSKPGQPEDKAFPKLSYVKVYKDWGWIVGTGDYIDDIDKEVFESVKLSIISNIIIAVLIIIFIGLRINKSIIDPIDEITRIAHRLAENDLTVEIEDDENQTEIGNLNRSFKKFTGNFRELISKVTSSVESVSSGAVQMSAAAEETAKGGEQVSNNITQLAAGSNEQARNVNTSVGNLNQINQAIQVISDDAENTVAISQTTEDNALMGLNHAESAVHKINQLKLTTVDISKTINDLGKLGAEIEVIVDLIKNIASQTNLLALNAAIEAARAGEHGKGFAVVADEVKKLAAQSATATDRITEMIKEIQSKTNIAVISMDENVQEVEESVIMIENVGQSLEQISHAAQETSEHIKNMSKEVNRLAKNSDEVARMMEDISAITEQSAASAEEIASATEEQTASLEEINAGSHTLARIAENLQSQISVFKV